MSRTARVGVGVLCALLWCAYLLWGWQLATADAEPAEYVAPAEILEPAAPEDQAQCPEPPEEPTAAEAVYQLQIPQFCRAVAERLDRVRERAFWSVAQLVKLEGRQDATDVLLEEIRDSLGEPVTLAAGEDGKPLFVRDEQVAENVDASGEALQGGLWFIAGLVAMGFVAYALHRLSSKGETS